MAAPFLLWLRRAVLPQRLSPFRSAAFTPALGWKGPVMQPFILMTFGAYYA
jgi:hypothetical protein